LSVVIIKTDDDDDDDDYGLGWFTGEYHYISLTALLPCIDCAAIQDIKIDTGRLSSRLSRPAQCLSALKTASKSVAYFLQEHE